MLPLDLLLLLLLQLLFLYMLLCVFKPSLKDLTSSAPFGFLETLGQTVLAEGLPPTCWSLFVRFQSFIEIEVNYLKLSNKGFLHYIKKKIRCCSSAMRRQISFSFEFHSATFHISLSSSSTQKLPLQKASRILWDFLVKPIPWSTESN